jgi:hypothetical protein
MWSHMREEGMFLQLLLQQIKGFHSETQTQQSDQGRDQTLPSTSQDRLVMLESG